MPNPCDNDGFCAEDKANEKGYMCICKQGFTGNQCHSKCVCMCMCRGGVILLPESDMQLS